MMMKKITLYTSLFIMGGVLLFSACKKQADMVAPYDAATENTAYLRVIHASPFFRQYFNAPDSFNVYVNGNKMNAPFLTYGSIFPQATSTFGYVAVNPGLQQIKMSINGFASASPDSTQLINFTKVFDKGKYYTLFVTDSLKLNPDRGFLVDTLTQPVTGNVRVRFFHAVMNDTAGKTVDIFSYARNTTVFNGIQPGGVTSFNTLGFNVGVADTFYVTRSAASGTPLANRLVLAKLAFAPTNQRSYTLYYRGDANLTSTPKARTLSSYLHN